MPKKCSKCNMSLGILENYGTRDTPLCFNCKSRDLTCAECKKEIDIGNELMYKSKIVCNKCFGLLKEKEKTELKEEFAEEELFFKAPIQKPKIKMQRYHRRKIRVYVFCTILVFLFFYIGQTFSTYLSARLSSEILLKIKPEIIKPLLFSLVKSISMISADIVGLILIIGFGQLFFGKLLYRRGAVKPSWNICKIDDCVLGFLMGIYIYIFTFIIIVLNHPILLRNPFSSSTEVFFENNVEIFAFAFSLLIAPIIEELLFRGLLYSAIRSIFGATPAFLITTFSFVIVHYFDRPITILNFLILITIASGTLWIRLKSDSVIPAIVLHFVHNACFTTVFLIWFT